MIEFWTSWKEFRTKGWWLNERMMTDHGIVLESTPKGAFRNGSSSHFKELVKNIYELEPSKKPQCLYGVTIGRPQPPPPAYVSPAWALIMFNEPISRFQCCKAEEQQLQCKAERIGRHWAWENWWSLYCRNRRRECQKFARCCCWYCTRENKMRA